jgi:hypothetical protein
MEPEGSLPYSQEPYIGPYPKSGQASPCKPSNIFEIKPFLTEFEFMYQLAFFYIRPDIISQILLSK